MAWPKLRSHKSKLRSHKSPGTLVTVSNPGGAASDRAADGPAATSAPPRESVWARPSGPAPAREPAEPAPDAPGSAPAGAPAAWPGGDVAAAGGSPDRSEASDETADVAFWDWAPPQDPGEPDDPGDGSSLDDGRYGFRFGPGDGPAGNADPPRPARAPVVTPVEEAGEQPRPGIGQRRGNLAHLSAHPRMRAWQWRAVIAIIVGVAFSILVSLRLALTLARIA